MSDDQLPLPGLDEPTRTASAIELAARRTIKALDELGLLDERHALTCQLIVDLAQSVDDGRRARRASAAAMAAAQLLAAIDRLPEPTDDPTEDPFEQLLREVAEADRADRA